MGCQPIRCVCLCTSASVTHQRPIRCLRLGKTLLTRAETSSAHCWPLHQQLLFSDHDGERPVRAWKPHPATWKESLCFPFVQESYRIWCCLCLALCLRGSFELCLRNPSDSCGVDLLAAFSPGESTAIPQCLKLGLTVPFKRNFSAHPMRDCITPIYSVAWVEWGNWDFCIKHWDCSCYPSICGSVCFSILCHPWTHEWDRDREIPTLSHLHFALVRE